MSMPGVDNTFFVALPVKQKPLSILPPAQEFA
jgi:hypothetical protein